MTPTVIDDLEQAHQDARSNARTVVREASDAASLVEALKEKVRSGDDVSAADIAAAKQLAEHAQLRAEAAARQAGQAKQTAHRARLDALAEELAALDADPDGFDGLLTAVETALENLAQAAARRTTDLRRFRDAMDQLGIPEGAPAFEHAGLSWRTPAPGSVEVSARGKVLRPVDVAPYISAAVHRLSVRHQMQVNGRSLHNWAPDLTGVSGQHDLHALLRSQA